MITKKQIIITQYLKIIYDLHMYVQINLFPDVSDVIDLIFFKLLFYWSFTSRSINRRCIRN